MSKGFGSGSYKKKRNVKQLYLDNQFAEGKNDDTNQVYLVTELLNIFRFNDRFSFNVSPKYVFS